MTPDPAGLQGSRTPGRVSRFLDVLAEETIDEAAVRSAVGRAKAFERCH